MGCCENPVYSHRCPKLMLRVCYVNYFRTRELVSRYKRPLRLCMSNKILRSANAKYHYYFWRNCRIPWICGLAVIPLMRLSRFTKTMNSSHKHRNISKVSLLYLFCRKTVKIMIFSIRTPQYFIFHYYKLSKVICNGTPALLLESSKLYFFCIEGYADLLPSHQTEQKRSRGKACMIQKKTNPWHWEVEKDVHLNLHITNQWKKERPGTNCGQGKERL